MSHIAIVFLKIFHLAALGRKISVLAALGGRYPFWLLLEEEIHSGPALIFIRIRKRFFFGATFVEGRIPNLF
jgi:hypothetical protein